MGFTGRHIEKLYILTFKGTGMLDEQLKQIRDAEEEARKILARGKTETDRIIKKVEVLKEKGIQQTKDDVKRNMTQLEKSRIQEAEDTAKSIIDDAAREAEEIRESVKPKVKDVSREIMDFISSG